MDSNASGFILNPPALHSTYYQPREDDGIIDLGLSLRTLQPEAYHPSGHRMPLVPFFNFCFTFAAVTR
jgi:auxin-responsive protein IAA